MRCGGVGGGAAAATGVDGLFRHWAAVWYNFPQFSHLALCVLGRFPRGSNGGRGGRGGRGSCGVGALGGCCAYPAPPFPPLAPAPPAPLPPLASGALDGAAAA